MAGFSTVWGLDIGNSAIKAVKMVRSAQEARIVDFDIIDIQGADDSSDRNTRVQSALKTLVGNHAFKNDPVFVALAGDLCLFKEFQLPAGSDAKLEELVQYEAKQQIPFPPEQVEMGYQKFDDPSGAVGIELVAVKKNIVTENLALFDQVGLNVQGISVAPVALCNLVQYEFNPNGITLILDAGFKVTDFVVMNGGQFFSRTIPIAGREITKALETKFKYTYEKAEELKKSIGQQKQADKILSVIEPTLRQLGGEVSRTVGFYKSKARGHRIANGFLLGHTFRLPKMAESLAAQIREGQISVVEGVQRLIIDRAVNPSIFAQEFPTMAVALGLGVQGLGLGHIDINLLPKHRKTQIEQRTKGFWGIVAAAVVLVAVVIAWQRAKTEKDSYASLSKELTEGLTDFNTQVKELGDAEKELPALLKKNDRYVRAIRDRGRLNQVFSRISALKDDSGRPFFGDANKVWLTNLYVSRISPTFDQGKLPPAETLGNRSRSDDLQASANFQQNSKNGIYAYLKTVPDQKGVFPELRVDLPIIVVVSGEFETDDGFRRLVETLKKIPEVADLRSSDRYTNPPRREVWPTYDHRGLVYENRPPGGEANRPYSSFHVAFRWKPADDPDIDPPAEKSAAPAPAAAPAGNTKGQPK